MFHSPLAAYTAALFAVLAPLSVLAAEGKDPYEDALLGNWGGARESMARYGVEPVLEYKADIWNIASGGLKRGNSYIDNLDIKFALDGEKLFGIQGNKALLYFINNNGGKPNERQVGSVQGIDNIETPTNTFKLYEAWMEQSFLDNKLSLLAGLHDLNSEFLVTDVSANFIKPVMQVPQSLAQSGQNGPSVFPTTSVAARLKYTPTETTYASFALFDGVPGDPNRPHGTHIDWRKGDGLLLIAEVGCTPKAAEGEEGTPNKFAIGGWSYTKRMDDLVDVDSNGNPLKRRMQGAYFLSSYQVYKEKASGRDINLFLRGGIADGNADQIDGDYELGVVGHGWIPHRSDAEMGLAMAQAHNSDKYIRSVGVADRNEYSYELYYRDKLYRGISVQPDIQYIVNPGTDITIKNATVLGVRLDINF